MNNDAAGSTELEKSRRTFHWIITAAFFTLFITGLIIYLPSLSGLASGGWTRLIHRVAAVILIGTPVVYAFTRPYSAKLWIREAGFHDKRPGLVTNTFKQTHKTLVIIGFIAFTVTGTIQWFLKGLVPNQVFQWSLSIHAIIFLSAIIVLVAHIYFETNWWIWKRRYCRNCVTLKCVDVCPSSALIRTSDGTIKYYSRNCNSCRLCTDYCRANSYFRKLPDKGRGNYVDSHT